MNNPSFIRELDSGPDLKWNGLKTDVKQFNEFTHLRKIEVNEVWESQLDF